MPIELWEIKKYSNDTILFNQIQRPEKVESIKTISQKSEVIKNVSKQVTVWTEEKHLQDKPESILRLYNELKESIFTIGQDITIKPKKVYIGYIRKSNFVDIVVYKSSLLLVLNLKKGTLNDPEKIARDVSNIGHWGNGDYEVKVENSSNWGYVQSLIRQSYDKN